MNARMTLVTGAVLGCLAVVLGATGAHALKPTLMALGKVDTFELANRYHFYHAVALLICGLLMKTTSSVSSLRYAAWCFLMGVVLFSGSLYLLCFYKAGWLGPVTPLGGLGMIAGWGLLAWAALKK
jgi:uncharacterized membrane protein YgdD (TMEM256/DUF423 family)